MPLNRPNNQELLESVTEFLQKKIIPQVDKHSAFHTKVAINVLNIVAREIEQNEAMGNSEKQRLQQLLNNSSEDSSTLNQELCNLISEGDIALDQPELIEHLWESTKAKVAIDNPRYATYKNLVSENQ